MMKKNRQSLFFLKKVFIFYSFYVILIWQVNFWAVSSVGRATDS